MKYNLMEQIGQAPKNGAAVKQAFFTKKGNALYAITPGWPGENFTVKQVATTSDPKVTLLGCQGELQAKKQGTDLVVTLPALTPGQHPTDYAYALKLAGVELLP